MISYNPRRRYWGEARKLAHFNWFQVKIASFNQMSVWTVRIQTPSSRLLVLQLLATFIVMLLVMAVLELSGWSREVLPVLLGVMMGGFIAIMSSAYSGWRAFRANSVGVDQPLSAERILADLFQAAIGKFLVAALLLGVAFRFHDYIEPKTVLFAFVVVTVLGSLGSSFFYKEKID